MPRANSFVLLFLLILCLTNCEQAPLDDRENSSTLALANIETISSEILGEDREVWVHVPDEFYGMDTTDITFPVIYVVDADGHFLPLVGIQDQLSSRFSANDECPPHIVVGIRNPNRNYDLTPPSADLAQDTLNRTGGAELFAKFLSDELIPMVNKKYPVAPHRTLAGHSLGGLFVMSTLLENQKLFDNYLAIDPALSWDNERFLDKATDAMKNKKFDDKNLYIVAAGPGFKGMTIEEVKSDTTELVNLTRSVFEFFDILDEVTPSGLNIKYELDMNENHFTIPLQGWSQGLKHIYEGYHFEKIVNYYDHDSPQRKEDIVDAITNHYDMLSDKMGYEVKPLESYVNAWAMGFGYNGEPELGERLYAYNLKNYPNSPFVHAANGYFQLSQQDTSAAIASFEKSQKLSYDDGLAEQIEELR